MGVKTHRSSLALYGVGEDGANEHGLYLPVDNLVDPNTSGQITYAEGTGVVIKGQIVSKYTGVDGYVLDIGRNIASATNPTSRLSQDSTTGANTALELKQSDVDQPLITLNCNATTGSTTIVIGALDYGGSSFATYWLTVSADGGTTFAIPLFQY